MVQKSLFYLSTAAVPSSAANGLQVMKMCQAFRQEGYDIRLVAPASPTNRVASVGDLKMQYGLTTLFPIVAIPTHGKARGVLYDLKAVMHARRDGVALTYTRSLRCAMFASLLGLRVVVEVHDLPGGSWGPRYMRTVLSSGKTVAVVIITEALRGALAERFGDHWFSRAVIAPDGVDLERFTDLPDPSEARRRLGLDPKDFTVGYAGSLYTGRGVEIIIELAARVPEGMFVVIGGPTTRAHEIQTVARARGIGNIIFVGVVPNGDLPLRLAACEVLLMPYQKSVSVSGGGDTARFMSPLKLFEYLATGRLILSSDLPVLREILTEGNAVLCPPEGIDSWEQSVRKAVLEEDWRRELGERARKDARQYDWRKRVRRIMAAVGE